jgi:ubiquinone/menaquinone biosynthesis C-methylase UbiE
MEAVMKWSRSEINYLLPILEQISFDLAPVDGKQILVLCSGTGDVVFWLGEMMEQGNVTGLELDTESLEQARHSLHEMGLEQVGRFLPAEKEDIPLPDLSFDALVREFVVYPTMAPTKIAQSKMARLLKPGGKMLLTDVIMTKPLPPQVRRELAAIGLEHLYEATPKDFQRWMTEAGLINIQLQDITSTLRKVWQDRYESDYSSSHEVGYTYLLDDPQTRLGRSIFYIYVRGEKPANQLLG